MNEVSSQTPSQQSIPTPTRGRLFERDVHVEKFLTAGDAREVRSPLFRKR